MCRDVGVQVLKYIQEKSQLTSIRNPLHGKLLHDNLLCKHVHVMDNFYLGLPYIDHAYVCHKHAVNINNISCSVKWNLAIPHL